MDTSPFDIYLIRGNITVFCGPHTEDFKKDVLNSSLLSDLASGSKHSHCELSWSEYVSTINKLGWITKGREFKRCEFSAKTLLKTVETCAETSLTKVEKQTLHNAFLQLSKPPTQSPVTNVILDRLRANTFDPGVKIIASKQTPVATSTRLTIVRNNANIISLRIAFQANDGINADILNQPVLSSIKDGKSNMWLLVSSLDAREYDKIRAAVIKKIGDHINTDVLHVPTPTLAG
ncbi:hypothetical protein [Pseudomonas sp. GW101-3H06]|jgi:hypothetical protein|uniref:hypothetical protein n=1 Tax=Pseudomonas sp. GW101-3H06 TaxID=2751347 RepID=UPI001A917931|nr:hypothetical protein [Pseudomonas sp. GW101-3H06]